MIIISLVLIGIYLYIRMCVRAVITAAYTNGAAAILLFGGCFALECQVIERNESIHETKFMYNFYPTFLQK